MSVEHRMSGLKSICIPTLQISPLVINILYISLGWFVVSELSALRLNIRCFFKCFHGVLLWAQPSLETVLDAEHLVIYAGSNPSSNCDVYFSSVLLPSQFSVQCTVKYCYWCWKACFSFETEMLSWITCIILSVQNKSCLTAIHGIANCKPQVDVKILSINCRN